MEKFQWQLETTTRRLWSFANNFHRFNESPGSDEQWIQENWSAAIHCWPNTEYGSTLQNKKWRQHCFGRKYRTSRKEKTYIQISLAVLEKTMDPSVLAQCKRAKKTGTWTGDVENVGLYFFCRKISTLSSNHD